MHSKYSKTQIERVMQKQYKTEDEAITEIINLQAKLNLPKGTEHFISDLHGQDIAFHHMIRNSSGVIKKYIDREFGEMLSPKQKESLAITIYYPKEIIKKTKTETDDINKWYFDIMWKLIRLCRYISSKYTRSKVRKVLPDKFTYAIEELLHTANHSGDKTIYYNTILSTIIDLDNADDFIVSICQVIHVLAIDKLHVVGDIYDRGPGPHKIIDELIDYHSVDVQWGNHDILWMGAAMGNMACIATVIRFCARHGQIALLEEEYGINLRPLAIFAGEEYKDDLCRCFKVKSTDYTADYEETLFEKMHKAITIIQFKLEGNIIKNNPNYNLNHRLLLDKISDDAKTVIIEGKKYPIRDIKFPTMNKDNPYELTSRELEVMDRLKKSFLYNQLLQKHLKFLMKKGSMYLVYNSNLILHGCVPMNDDGTFKNITVFGETLTGQAAFDAYDNAVRDAYYDKNSSSIKSDICWYLWCGRQSPLFGKKDMKTFETYFVEDKKTHSENRNAYYRFREDENICKNIIVEFGINAPFSHIINGHVPVKVKDGESPVKANGKLIVIDGGLNPVYQSVTGIAGYTLIYDSYSLSIAQHERFISKDEIIENEHDILYYTSVCDQHDTRLMVKDTYKGMLIMEDIELIKKLVDGYRQERR